MLPVYVLTNDKHLFLLKGFTTCFSRFWPNQKVTIAGFHPPAEELPAGFHFESLGDENLPANRWSDGLLQLLARIPDPHFILLLEDYWLCAPVDVLAVHSMFRFMQYIAQHDEVLRVDLSGDRASIGITETAGRWENTKILQSLPGSPYQMSMQAAIWNRDVLGRLLKPGWNPWQTEMIGTEMLNQMGPGGPKVYGTETSVFCYQPVYRSGRGRWQLDKIPGDVLDQIKPVETV